jgi:hypothetical protein
MTSGAKKPRDLDNAVVAAKAATYNRKAATYNARRKRCLSIHDLRLAEIPWGSPGQVVAMQSGNYPLSTARAQKIYAFYRMAPCRTAEYDS